MWVWRWQRCDADIGAMRQLDPQFDSGFGAASTPADSAGVLGA